MDIVDEIIEFFKRKARVRKFKQHRGLLEIAFEIAGESVTKNGQIKALKDLIRISNESRYGGANAKLQLTILKAQYVDGISREKLKSWGFPIQYL